MRSRRSSRMTSRSGRTVSSFENEVLHAIGFEIHHEIELILGDALVVAGVIAGGEGIAVAAIDADQPVQFAGGIFGRALEHQMFEEMRDARLAHRLIGGAHLVIDHVGDDRGAMIGNDDDLHAVGEREGGNILDDRFGRYLPSEGQAKTEYRTSSNLRIADIRDLMLARRASLNRARARPRPLNFR